MLVSEAMLQQTPVARVLAPYQAWMSRWPTPASLAQEPAGEAVRMWGRLGYPRRALRLHQAAAAIDAEHDGIVPSTYAELRRLPGVGDYTAAAVAAFAYHRRALVLDTNVRRVLSRIDAGAEFPPAQLAGAERARAADVLPDDAGTSARWNVAVMELGALVCRARDAACFRCPVQNQCAWYAAGRPRHAGPPRRTQTYAGTDRQCRGRILGLLRDAEGPVPADEIASCWDVAAQRERAVASLVHDGLVVRVVQPSGDAYRLP